MIPLMTIKAPRGKVTIYPVPDINSWWLSRHMLAKKRTAPFNEFEQRSYSHFVKLGLSQRAEGIKAFMRQHNVNGSSRPRRISTKAR